MITATNNSQIKQIMQWNQKTKARKEDDVFLVEGSKMFLETPLEWVRKVYVAQSFYQKCYFIEKIAEFPYEIVSDEVYRKISDTMTPQGIMCVVSQKHYVLKDLLQKESPLLVLLEDIQDPGNLGTIIRTSEGAGVDGIIMSKDTVDIYNPKTIRATMGSVFRMPFIYVEDMIATLSSLRQVHIVTYAADLKGEEYYDSNSYRNGTAFLIGNEGNGLKEKTLLAADRYVKIPMEGQVESLNASIATSLLIYEANRQRREDKKIKVEKK